MPDRHIFINEVLNDDEALILRKICWLTASHKTIFMKYIIAYVAAIQVINICAVRDRTNKKTVWDNANLHFNINIIFIEISECFFFHKNW